uniref:Uncharacterized protein n=1 Tax=Physcomitrium patens TaxID=3218 RepID=A0A2K1IFH4_PHYPA|nr:hypothetical protein PHYPA_028623 [Physcomitrium patens]
MEPTTTTAPLSTSSNNESQQAMKWWLQRSNREGCQREPLTNLIIECGGGNRLEPHLGGAITAATSLCTKNSQVNSCDEGG